MKYKSHKINPPYDLLPPEIQQLQLWAQTLPPKVAVTEKDDYIPEEFQLLYEIQQFGHSLGWKAAHHDDRREVAGEGLPLRGCHRSRGTPCMKKGLKRKGHFGSFRQIAR